MRIVSLVPSATEMLFAHGLGSDVVGVTHECDFPSDVASLPRVTRDILPPGLSAIELDAAVKERAAEVLDSQPMVIPLDPHSIGEVLGFPGERSDERS